MAAQDRQKEMIRRVWIGKSNIEKQIPEANGLETEIIG